MAGFGNWVTRRAERTPEAVALVAGDAGESITYRRLAERCAARAGSLRSAGVGRGDRVMLLSSNSIEMIETMFATAQLGAIVVPVNYRLSAAEIAFLISDASPTVLVHDGSCASLAAQAVAESPLVRPLIHIAALSDGARIGEEDVPSTDIAMIMYTSGTTGQPKGAMLTHGNFEANAINMLTAGRGITREDSTVAVAPLFHIGCLGLYTLPLLYAGGRVVVQEAFVPHRTLALIAEHRISLQFLVPSMWDALAKVESFDDYDLSSLRCLLSGGAPSPLPVIDFYQGKGLTFMEGFGMTELAPACLVLEAEYVRSHAGSVGRPFFHTDIRIVDEQDVDVPVGEVGELVVRGPNVFAGYWGLPEASADSMRGGWFHSGDLAKQDNHGFVTLVDRKKDMVISGGENVYPIEVEQVLFRHPDIVEAAVIGVPDENWGEAVTAVLVRREGADLDAQAITEYCRERIARFKCPRRVEFVDELPRNATGKVLKRDLRRAFGRSEAAVSR